jgi:hypothetical protein
LTCYPFPVKGYASGKSIPPLTGFDCYSIFPPDRFVCRRLQRFISLINFEIPTLANVLTDIVYNLARVP